MPEVTSVPPNAVINNLLIFLIAFGGYYLGIIIRKRVFKSGPSLQDQFLLGIPVSLIVLTPFIPIIQNTITHWSIIMTVGLIIEHGMVVNETATAHLRKMIDKAKESSAPGLPQ